MKYSSQAMLLLALFIVGEVFLYLFLDKPTALFFANAEIVRTPHVEFFRHITDLGLGKWYLYPCGLTALFCAFLSRGQDVLPPLRRLFGYVGVRALFLFVTIALSGIIADIIKPLAGRARPGLWLNNGIYGFFPGTFDAHWNGMPSGHTTTAFALACSLSIFYRRLRILWFGYALMLAASRIIIDAHYISDVCAGAALGWLTVRLVHKHVITPLSKVVFPIDSMALQKD
jgi:undecaprenyl-diphosphatase